MAFRSHSAIGFMSPLSTSTPSLPGSFSLSDDTPGRGFGNCHDDTFDDFDTSFRIGDGHEDVDADFLLSSSSSADLSSDSPWLSRSQPTPPLPRSPRNTPPHIEHFSLDTHPRGGSGIDTSWRKRPTTCLPTVFTTGDGVKLHKRTPKRLNREQPCSTKENASEPPMSPFGEPPGAPKLPRKSTMSRSSASLSEFMNLSIPEGSFVIPSLDCIDTDASEERPFVEYCETMRMPSAKKENPRRYGSAISHHSRVHPGPQRSLTMSQANPEEYRLLTTPAPILKTIVGSHKDCNTITCEMLAAILKSGKLPAPLTRLRIIDARYTYEFDGGAIRTAENILSVEHLQSAFFPPPSESETTAIVFHCEFSSQRGPNLYRKLRSLDRTAKGSRHYPALFYPQLYLLEGGYRDFFTQFPTFCWPEQYVPMKDTQYRQNLQKIRCEKSASKQHARGLRSQSFAGLPSPGLPLP